VDYIPKIILLLKFLIKKKQNNTNQKAGIHTHTQNHHNQIISLGKTTLPTNAKQ